MEDYDTPPQIDETDAEIDLADLADTKRKQLIED